VLQCLEDVGLAVAAMAAQAEVGGMKRFHVEDVEGAMR